MMATDATLDDIALGDVEPAQARAALSKALQDGDARMMQQAYVALRAWVWKALDGRRRDPELREWFDIFKRVAAFVRTKDVALAERVVALHELVHESIAVSDRLPVEEILQRRHVRKVLAMLMLVPGGRLDRTEIGRRLGLKQGNLTRVLNMVTEAGLAERTAHGKQAEFQLTRAGHEAAGSLGLRKLALGAIAAPQPKIAPLIGMKMLDLPAGISVLGIGERQVEIVTGYIKHNAGALAVQQVASRNLFSKAPPIELARAVFPDHGYLGGGATSLLRNARNTWTDVPHV